MTYVMNFYSNEGPDAAPSPPGRKWSLLAGFQSMAGGANTCVAAFDDFTQKWEWVGTD